MTKYILKVSIGWLDGGGRDWVSYNIGFDSLDQAKRAKEFILNADEAGFDGTLGTVQIEIYREPEFFSDWKTAIKENLPQLDHWFEESSSESDLTDEQDGSSEDEKDE